MKRLILLVALVMAMAVLAPAAFADDEAADADETKMMEEKDPSDAQLWKAQMIADYFSTFLEEPADSAPAVEETSEDLDETLLPFVQDLRGTTGWGAVFKIMMYAAATGEDPRDIGPFAEDGGYAFGKLFKGVDFEGEFTNLGQMQKSYKEKPEKDMPAKSQKNKDKTGN